MKPHARRLLTVALCCLPCFVFPLAIAKLVLIYGPESDPGMDATWPLYTIDLLFCADVFFTAILVWTMRGWRWLTAVVAVPSLCVTAVLAIFGGMWVSGNYF